MSQPTHTPVVDYDRHVPTNVNEALADVLNPLNKAGLTITRLVGTMIAAILFACLALISLPSALRTHDKIVIVAWVAQTFLQLVLLPIIMVGQNLQGKHTELMADEEFKTTKTTYKDLEHLILVNKQQLDLLLSMAKQK